MRQEKTKYTITLNKSRRTYTIRRYDNGKLVAKYRSYPQTKQEYSENWTEGDIKAYLRNSNDYYEIN